MGNRNIDTIDAGVPVLSRAASLRITPRAMLGRGVSVIRGKTLIINLPGRVVVTNLIARSIMIIVISVICTVYFFAPLSEYFAKLFGAEPESGAYYGVCVGTFFIISCLLALAVCTFGISIPKKLCVSGKIGESFILNAGGIYRGFLAAFRPLEAVSGLISKGILRLFGVKNIGRNDAVTEEEILMMVDAVNETGGIEESQAEMISNIFDFDDIEVRAIPCEEVASYSFYRWVN